MVERVLNSLFFLLCLVGIIPASGQVAVNSGEGSLTGSSFGMTYSIGEPIHHTLSNPEYTVIAGIQQEYEVNIYTYADPVSADQFIRLYPNPATHYIEWEISEITQPAYRGLFFDIEGRVVKQFTIDTPNNRLEISDLSSGTYILQIIKGDTVVKHFKVIKKER